MPKLLTVQSVVDHLKIGDMRLTRDKRQQFYAACFRLTQDLKGPADKTNVTSLATKRRAKQKAGK